MKRGYATKRFYSCRCQSGIMGTRTRIRNNYVGLEEFFRYTDQFNLHGRLGYVSPLALWIANPVIESSTIPSDLRKVKDSH
jgi:hypothetical protein